MIKENCFFYKKGDKLCKCGALRELVCKERECSFYKTKEREALDRIKYGYNLKVDDE